MTRLTSLYEIETRFPRIIAVVATEMNLHISTGGVRFSRVVIVVVRVVVCVGL